jgi:hypothetical protein
LGRQSENLFLDRAAVEASGTRRIQRSMPSADTRPIPRRRQARRGR